MRNLPAGAKPAAFFRRIGLRPLPGGSWQAARIVRYRRDVRERNPRGLANQRNQQNNGDTSALDRERKDQRPPPDLALPFLLLWIAFDKASVQDPHMVVGALARFVRHHTPPHSNAANRRTVLRRRPAVYC